MPAVVTFKDDEQVQLKAVVTKIWTETNKFSADALSQWADINSDGKQFRKLSFMAKIFDATEHNVVAFAPSDFIHNIVIDAASATKVYKLHKLKVGEKLEMLAVYSKKYNSFKFIEGRLIGYDRILDSRVLSLTNASLSFREGYISFKQPYSDTNKLWCAGTVVDTESSVFYDKLVSASKELDIFISIEGNPRVISYSYGEPSSILYDERANAKIVKKDFTAINQLIARNTNLQAISSFVFALRKLLKDKLVSVQAIKDLMHDYKLEDSEKFFGNSVYEFVELMVLKANYRLNFFNYLKANSQLAFYSDFGCAFVSKNYLIFTIPIFGLSTRVFKLDNLVPVISKEILGTMHCVEEIKQTSFESWSDKLRKYF